MQLTKEDLKKILADLEIQEKNHLINKIVNDAIKEAVTKEMKYAK